MQFRLALGALCFSLVVLAQMRMTVAQLDEFIKSSVKLHQDDRKVAEYLKKVQLTEKLTDLDVEELQSMGAGPRTVSALHDLRDASASMPAAKPPAPKPVYIGPPPPSSIEQKKVLDETRQYALSYTKSLPDFICMQVTRRYVDPAGLEMWQHADTIAERLSYFENHEDYKVVLVNNRPVNDMSHNALGGATSSGEFGTMLREIFAPDTDAEFEWDRWATLRGRRMHVFTYHVSSGRSQYRVTETESQQSIIIGYHGNIYVDRDTGAVMKITLENDEIPATFPIREVHLAMDYAPQAIGDRQFILPLKASLTSRMGQKALIKNEVEFRMYRKFTAESTIKAVAFDTTPEPLPPDATAEQPAKPPIKK